MNVKVTGGDLLLHGDGLLQHLDDRIAGLLLAFELLSQYRSVDLLSGGIAPSLQNLTYWRGDAGHGEGSIVSRVRLCLCDQSLDHFQSDG